MWIDAVLYRPAVVKLSAWLPRWWNCQLAHLSMRLDDRWGTGYWRSESAPAAPNGPCDACGRRAAWLMIGGAESDEELDTEDYLQLHPIQVCGWCRLDSSAQIESQADLDRALDEARGRSVTWAWRWRPTT